MPARPKLTAEERCRRAPDRRQTIRLRLLNDQVLHDRDITTPTATGAAIGLPAAQATELMTGKPRRAGDVALLEAATMRL